MIRIKTLSLPLVSALLASTAVPAGADVAFELSSHKEFRQTSDGETAFRGGDFDVNLRDGTAIYVGGCDFPFYVPPNLLRVCSGGSTGFVTFGDLVEDVQGFGPYFWITQVIPAIILEPRRPELCILKAAPASDLPRPYSGFKDSSFGVYYNLHTNSVIESVITRYDTTRTYSAKDRQKFEDEIVPGVYHYSLPRLNQPTLRVTVKPTIFPMVDGYKEKNNKKTGVQFDMDNRWTQSGYMELSYTKPNVIQWKGFDPSSVFASVDSLYFSFRFLTNPANPLSDVTTLNPDTFESPAAIFPSFVNGAEPRIQMANPYVTSFTLPPIFRSGTRGVIELELERAFQTGGVTYDFSTRRFQVPVVIVNLYSEYSEVRFGSTTKNTGILDDFDKDGYNNLNEWILESRADDDNSIPVPPVATNHPAVFNSFLLPITEQYYGFTVVKQRNTRPAVKYTLQRSVNGGVTWKKMNSSANWTVTETADEIKVESAILNNVGNQIQPPGTAGHLYRLKITLAK